MSRGKNDIFMSKNSKCKQLILEGNIYYNRKQYKKSAKQYERAGQWAVNNSLSKEIIKEAFCLAITSWISACKMDNVFRILEKEIFDGKYEILKSSYKKIEGMVNFLVNKNKMEQTSGNELLEKVKRKLKEIKPLTLITNEIDVLKPLSGKGILRKLQVDLQRKKS